MTKFMKNKIRIAVSGLYVNVIIRENGDVEGMLADQNYKYNSKTNTGGRRYLGNVLDVYYNKANGIDFGL